ncbi:hypothetical protein E0Z10_g3003 [Xylaria hypoxylon]|uniref:Zn(2)-C6 fungal-type domain-containing protein n=1 Tax=Xylaria hypoxylon TaxID=37992 RepID=A0A4Z0YPN5_9PEZI|nr:hypothetical protein E0Z10_g3003 [Xylaria hypoxylon]
MPLKRGLERESCDFCFRRKIKCDRSSRATTGRPSCSQCNLRQTPCTFECDDVRTQRRRKNSPKGTISSNASVDVNTSIGTKAQENISYAFVDDVEWTHTRNSPLTFGNDTLPPPFSDGPAASGQLPLDIGISMSTQSSEVTALLPTYPDFDFELSPKGISFLDSIFLQSHDTTEPIMNWDNMPDPALQHIDEPQNSLAPTKNPYCALDIQPEILDAAIDAYFGFASLALPILSKDGFMTDYKARQSGSALVFAVACRGCPFIQETEKWSLQQRFASRFKETFLQARSTTSSQDVVRLDDLEALALMVDFEYDGSKGLTSPLQSQLENLLLTHDSLVVMTLQYRIENRLVAATGIYTTLSRATKRQTILFWYVYGWDAFRSLDRKMASRIRDEDIDLSRQLHGHESQGYFDAILGLAVIAQKMARTLCSPVAKRKGVKHQDIENLYTQLAEWRMHIYPETKDFLPIQKAVILLLELNCFMQLEACVLQYGIEDRSSAMGQIVDMRVKYETLRSAYKIVEVAQWIEKVTTNQRMLTFTTTHAMTDLAPGVIRNICAGASNWISRKAKETFQSTASEGLNPTIGIPDSVFGVGNTAELLKEQARSWMDSSTTLRDIAATATSHRDTEHLIERLDLQLGSLKALVSAYEV